MAKPPKNGVRKVRFLTEVDFSRLRIFLVGFLEKLASSTIFGEGGAYIVERGSAKNSLKIFAHRKNSNQNIF